jgi:hypothetical protein
MLEADGEVQEPLQPDSVSRCTSFSLLLGFIVSLSCFLPLSSISLFSLPFPLFSPLLPSFFLFYLFSRALPVCYTDTATNLPCNRPSLPTQYQRQLRQIKRLAPLILQVGSHPRKFWAST